MKQCYLLLVLGLPGMAVANEPIQPVEKVTVSSPEKVELGKMLFFEPRLSKSNAISCNSCHNLATGGVDNQVSSLGHKWQEGPINSPTVLNASLNFVQFWDGRAKDLKEQAAGPIANPLEMAFTHQLAVETLQTMAEYRTRFNTIYGKRDFGIDEVTDAIAAFEETLVTPNAPFDRWLKGDTKALTAQQLNGYKLFKEKGCVACHNGVAIGGNSYQKMGLIKPFATQNKAEGRGAVTGEQQLIGWFKVPTLRNIELTAPYFHDGSVWDLKQAVTIMADIQLGQTLTEQESDDMTAYLKSLTGDQPQIVLPILPPSSPTTPKPEVKS
ncbi:cytochrome-c peroxidase [Aeromonas cavernicola]|uniref:Cytochrome C biogenesis protein CcsA n=1 Tax=Aeromonas cavernicola TaxID=1006623 RepID=A0A2H9U2U4_9GAMM|nr:cytochrome-c peroxidase [Aeromonas cavernicola]PJG58377.1 cytochrome C biogenesis protein CcsA [Aeromonas cavernicola]